MLSGKGVVALAVVLGLTTSLMVWYYVERATAQAQPVRTVPVVVATRNIPSRTLITQDMVQVAQIPQEARHPDALSDVDSPVGKVTKIALTAQEQVLTTKLFAERKESGLAFLIPPGRRAVSVGVSERIGSGGLIVPGDRVDVVVIYDDRTVGQTMATLVLQNIEVLAIAQLLEGDERKSTTGRSLSSLQLDSGLNSASSAIAGAQNGRTIDPAPQPNAKTATLAVTPEEAAQLILAEEMGTIRLALRPYGDTEIVPPPQALLPGTTLPVAAASTSSPAGR
ncbi:MAG: Flp pilus assembly protein CpaB [Chloroflexi bacterium]|nr:Flp pilus assembly protein CpaB [Chloroflexota bacterium]